MDQHIQHQVDELLLEQGEYQPLEFLLREGRLFYADYEAWRNGELPFLDEALFGDPAHIQEELRQAETYLQRRDWQAETINYKPWPGNKFQQQVYSAPQALTFSENTAFDRCFHRAYRKPQDQPQMDLFTDAPATSLANGVIQALTDRDAAEARRQLERLYDIAPDHVHIGELEQLVEALEQLPTPVDDAAADMRTLHETLTPMAESLLGKRSRELLIPLWRRLSTALQEQPYQASQPELHLSYTAGQAANWNTVREAVEREANWQANAVLLLRHARACDQLQQQSAALQSWFLLCWRFPRQCDALESSNDYELRQQWVAFLELDPELPPQTFPAWLLCRKPGITRIVPEPDTDSACPDSYRGMFQLQQAQLEPNENSEQSIELRAQLKQQDAVLFDHYIDKIKKIS